MTLPDPVFSAMISVGVSIATTIVAAYVKDSFETQVKISRMMLGLCVDCTGTVNAFEGQTHSLRAAADLIAVNSNPSEDLALLRSAPCGFVVSPPLAFPKELINLLPAEQARTIFYYYDRWERFSALESRYCALFELLLSDIADAMMSDEAGRRYKVLRDERFDQLSHLMKDLDSTIGQLLGYCCEILLMSPAYLDHNSAQSVEMLTDGRWKSWQGVRESCARFHEECGP